MESPYCYRLRNLIELSLMSEADTVSHVEEFSVELAVRPTKFSLCNAPLEFIGNYLGSVKTETG